MKTKKKKSTNCIGKKIIDKIWAVGLVLYLFAVLLILPLYIYDKYWDMAWYKWQVYLNSTCFLLLFAGVLLIIGRLYRLFVKADAKVSKTKLLTDYIVAAYGLLVVISFITCPGKAAAWMGTEGWYMGVIAQLLFVATYFLFSGKRVAVGVLLVFHGIASAFCYFYAICQRLGNDWLYLYWDMPAEVVRDYLSTIGNRTWFSAYICTAFPIGMYLFWYVKKTWARWLSGAYMLLSFCCMVMVNSDSMYAGLFAVIFGLSVLSVGDVDKWKRFGEILVLWFGACIVMLILRDTIPEFPQDARGLSRLFLNLKVSLPAFCLSLACRAVLELAAGGIKGCKWHLGKKTITQLDYAQKRLYQGRVLKIALLMCITLVVFIYCNTTDAGGAIIDNNYLVFGDAWGDNRGHTWKLTLKMFSELPLTQKLFGAGADCFAYIAYSNEEYAAALQSFWGTDILANAHNEWLNSLFCFGILGGLAYLGIFGAAAYECLGKSDVEQSHPLIPAIGLCVVAYMTHNFFCYQQVCATPIMFLLMGVASQLKKR